LLGLARGLHGFIGAFDRLDVALLSCTVAAVSRAWVWLASVALFCASSMRTLAPVMSMSPLGAKTLLPVIVLLPEAT
jgi:phosphatidylglycerophosphate synthase